MAELDKWRLVMFQPAPRDYRRVPKGQAATKKGEDAYAADYEAVTPLQRYASEHRLAICS